MGVFKNESDMQTWLKKKLASVDGLSSLIVNSNFLENFQPTTKEQKEIHQSFSKCYDAIHLTEMLSDDKDVLSSKGKYLRPDFILYSPETEGIVVVELKNNSKATREAGTEINAYSMGVRKHIPFLYFAGSRHMIFFCCQKISCLM